MEPLEGNRCDGMVTDWHLTSDGIDGAEANGAGDYCGDAGSVPRTALPCLLWSLLPSQKLI